MPVIINQNVHVMLGLVNGKEGIAMDIVLDECSSVYALNQSNIDLPEILQGQDIWIVDRPPKCLFVQVQDARFKPLSGLSEGLVPVYPQTFTVHMPDQLNKREKVKVRRFQIPCCPGFAITDYKAQGRTFDNILVDLESTNSFGQHRKFTAVYVALSRCRSLDGLNFL
ncbi:hypothetical protein BDZ91DRAFT_687651, partial [Kalaharituber pfeilii]